MIKDVAIYFSNHVHEFVYFFLFSFLFFFFFWQAAEVELHDPAVCCVCEKEQASLALKSFIRRKTTQLRYQSLKARLNTHLSSGGGGRAAGTQKVISLN